MPRLLSSYAANKRVEDGLRRKQEQIRLDYIRATHRHVDETEKLVDDLIQINVRTPSAFQTSRLPNANHQRRMPAGSHQQLHLPANDQQPLNLNQHNVHMLNMTQHEPTEQLVSLRNCRSRSCLTNDGTTEDSMSMTRKEVPLPIVQVKGKEVFYQYESQRSNWKKIEPSYRTKMLLQRNDTVSNALRQFSTQRNQDPQIARELMLPRNSNVSLYEPDISRRSSLFSRRGSRKDSRVSNLSDDDGHVAPLVELKPQLSPGHTPRMLDGWTIMNWCLWNKQQSKPVWATKRYMDKKSREFKRFQATRTAHKNELPVKPSSANSTTREARRRDSIAKQSIQTNRAKSVPAHKVSMTIEEEEEDEEEDEENEEKEVNAEVECFQEPERVVLRPTTSILRLPKNGDIVVEDESRPKTTQTHRRIALDTTLSPKEHLRPHIIISDPRNSKSYHDVNRNNDDYNLHQFKSDLEGKSVKICAPREPDEPDEESEMFYQDRIYKPDNQFETRTRNKSQRLARTEITVATTGETAAHMRNSQQFTPIVSLVKPVQIDYPSTIRGVSVLSRF